MGDPLPRPSLIKTVLRTRWVVLVQRQKKVSQIELKITRVHRQSPHLAYQVSDSTSKRGCKVKPLLLFFFSFCFPLPFFMRSYASTSPSTLEPRKLRVHTLVVALSTDVWCVATSPRIVLLQLARVWRVSRKQNRFCPSPLPSPPPPPPSPPPSPFDPLTPWRVKIRTAAFMHSCVREMTCLHETCASSVARPPAQSLSDSEN